MDNPLRRLLPADPRIEALKKALEEVQQPLPPAERARLKAEALRKKHARR